MARLARCMQLLQVSSEQNRTCHGARLSCLGHVRQCYSVSTQCAECVNTAELQLCWPKHASGAILTRCCRVAEMESQYQHIADTRWMRWTCSLVQDYCQLPEVQPAADQDSCALQCQCCFFACYCFRHVQLSAGTCNVCVP